jgi:hypothetical protein
MHHASDVNGLPPNADDVLAAVGLHAQGQIDFWHAMIALAAAESACDVLWT